MLSNVAGIDVRLSIYVVKSTNWRLSFLALLFSEYWLASSVSLSCILCPVCSRSQFSSSVSANLPTHQVLHVADGLYRNMDGYSDGPAPLGSIPMSTFIIG
ncbi:uncharacterized protein N7500_007561 [Penicillium coprophilum]|uniref:uncharacterized protein n=1 Tax=Penicillium coprophilum TaxID=36646 RepID=UPI0023A49C98|nr:uncharacterized protein N7500_005315 [Penicillium coprophilum]XP_056533705.1 uncharacterized protein N7500_007561 [Penicillium coprophilum]KAJ5163485.1 hypothetical protein N7500_005315 [Penicillium coprophilum]KAJ5165731.1 hypothetical protein N7500_007561 [Penicillium coprophilum]